MRLTHALTALAAAALLAPATAMAGDYPAPRDPGGVRDPNPGRDTHQVCKQRGCDHRTIQSAVREAGPGDTIRVGSGVYREQVSISGSRYDDLKLIGNVARPRSVQINARGRQHGVIINGADNVTVRGFYAHHYAGNGFFAVNVDGYLFRNLIASYGGAYGVYAFNSKGGTISDSEAYYNNDSGFYIGQTPPQTRPKRSIVERVKAWGNVLGWSGTNMRYVTIRNSDWYNNGLGIVPNALESERFPPPEFNVISGNRVFWNNFNYFHSAPFRLRRSSTGELAYPVGTGILLFGSQDTTVENNQIFGHYLMGFGAVEQILLSLENDPRLKEAAVLRNNRVRNNRFGLNGRDLNGRDMFYDGTGSGNCFSNNSTRSQNVPVNNGTFQSCPFTGNNTKDQAAQTEAVNWTLAQPDAGQPAWTAREKFWIKNPHSRQGNLRPLEHFRP